MLVWGSWLIYQAYMEVYVLKPLRICGFRKKIAWALRISAVRAQVFVKEPERRGHLSKMAGELAMEKFERCLGMFY